MNKEETFYWCMVAYHYALLKFHFRYKLPIKNFKMICVYMYM